MSLNKSASPLTVGAAGTVTAVSGTGVASQPVAVTQSNTSVANETVVPTALTSYTRDGILHISGLTAGESLRVYSILGSPVWQGKATADRAEVALPTRGIFIIATGTYPYAPVRFLTNLLFGLSSA